MTFKKKPNFSKKIIPLVCVFLPGLFYMGCTVVRTSPQALPEAERIPVKRYFMKQRMWTLGDSFVIKNRSRNPVFFVKGKPFTIGTKLKFFDRQGHELLYIKQKLFSFKHMYRIYRDHKLYAKVTKRIRVFNDKYIVYRPGADNYVVKGNFAGYHYNIFCRGRRVAQISKKWPAWTDHYLIEIAPEEDEILILASAVIIDMISHNNQRHSHPYD